MPLSVIVMGAAFNVTVSLVRAYLEAEASTQEDDERRRAEAAWHHPDRYRAADLAAEMDRSRFMIEKIAPVSEESTALSDVMLLERGAYCCPSDSSTWMGGVDLEALMNDARRVETADYIRERAAVERAKGGDSVTIGLTDAVRIAGWLDPPLRRREGQKPHLTHRQGAHGRPEPF